MSPDRDAIWFEGQTTSFQQFAARVRRTAAALAALGVRTGDRVAWVSSNHPSALETLCACGQLGAVWVPLNARFTAPEAHYVLAHCGASVVVHGPQHGELADALRDSLPAVRAWVAVEPGPTGATESVPYEQLLAAADPHPLDHPVTLDDPCVIMYTSGTTGRPKGATLTHGNMTWACLNQILSMDLGPTERTLSIAPLFHIGGLNAALNTLLRGGCVVIVARFEPAGALTVIEEQRINSFFAVPTMLDAMARSPAFAHCDVSALRTIVAAGAPVPLATLRSWLDRGVNVQQAYGMTESSPSGTMLDSTDAVAKAGSAGKPQFFTDVRVINRDGIDVVAGEVGEVVLQGPNIMAGYWKDPDATTEAIVDGWYRSEDAATLDDDGYLYIRDRYKDMIISGGENIYPAEVESALRDLPDVVEAAVIGIPHPTWGEVGLAVVVLVPGVSQQPAALLGALRERLAGYKVPRHVHFVDTLPKTATGKVRKLELQARYRPQAHS